MSLRLPEGRRQSRAAAVKQQRPAASQYAREVETPSLEHCPAPRPAASKQTETGPAHISISRPPWHNSAGPRRPGPRQRRGLPSIPASPFTATVPAYQATIRPIGRNASVSTMACARPGCRRYERPVICAPAGLLWVQNRPVGPSAQCLLCTPRTDIVSSAGDIRKVPTADQESRHVEFGDLVDTTPIHTSAVLT